MAMQCRSWDYQNSGRLSNVVGLAMCQANGDAGSACLEPTVTVEIKKHNVICVVRTMLV